jgi:hypothetical protein
MKKLRELGIIPAIGFLLGTIGQIGFWRMNVDLILHGYKYLPFAIAPIFAFFSAWFMVGKVNFSYWSESDNNGNKAYNLFLAIAIIMLIFSIGISFEAISEA